MSTEKYRKYLNEGFTARDTAKALKVTPQAVYSWARKRGEVFKKPSEVFYKARMTGLNSKQQDDYNEYILAGCSRIEALQEMVKSLEVRNANEN